MSGTLYPAFTPPFNPLEPLEDSLQARRIDAQFGDNYIQSALDGLNAEASNIQLTFEPLSFAQYQAIDSFLNACYTSGNPFAYALPIDGVTKYWWPQSWTPTRQGTYYSLLINIVQVFPPGD